MEKDVLSVSPSYLLFTAKVHVGQKVCSLAHLKISYLPDCINYTSPVWLVFEKT